MIVLRLLQGCCLVLDLVAGGVACRLHVEEVVGHAVHHAVLRRVWVVLAPGGLVLLLGQMLLT